MSKTAEPFVALVVITYWNALINKESALGMVVDMDWTDKRLFPMAGNNDQHSTKRGPTMQIMKKTILVVGALMLAATAAWAVDYTKMSNDELSAARGQLNQASAEDWNGFHTEWWKRLSQMSPEERQKYLGPGMGRGMGQGKGMGHHGMGRGMGCCPCGAATNTTPPVAK